MILFQDRSKVKSREKYLVVKDNGKGKKAARRKPVPDNPLGLSFQGDNGENLDPNSLEFVSRFAASRTLQPSTKVKYDGEWKLFCEWGEKNSSVGPGGLKALEEGRLGVAIG